MGYQVAPLAPGGQRKKETLDSLGAEEKAPNQARLVSPALFLSLSEREDGLSQTNTRGGSPLLLLPILAKEPLLHPLSTSGNLEQAVSSLFSPSLSHPFVYFVRGQTSSPLSTEKERPRRPPPLPQPS